MTTPAKCIQVQLAGTTDDQAAESGTGREGIVSDKRTWLQTAAVELEETMEWARPVLKKIVRAIEDPPRSGQARRLVRFPARVYNGQEFHLDPIDLRSLETELASACLDYLNYDRLGIHPRSQFSQSMSTKAGWQRWPRAQFLSSLTSDA